MIESLTSEQELKLKEYEDKWTAIGLDTTQFNESIARPIINNLYTEILDYPKNPFLYIAESPIEAWFAVMFLYSIIEDAKVWDKVGDKVGAKVGAKVRAKVEAKVRDKVRDKVGDKVWAKVRDKVGDKVWAKVWDKVRDKVGDKVWAKVWDKVRAKVGDKVRAKVWAKVEAKVGDKVRAKVEAKVRDKVRDKVGDKVWAKVRDKVGDKVWAKVWDKVRDKVGDKVWAKVWDKVRAKVGDKVRAKVWAKVEAKVGDKVRAKVEAKVRDKVRDKVGDKVWAKVRDKVEAKVRDKVRDKVGDKVWDKVWAKVRAKVWAKVEAKVGDKVRDKVWDKVRDKVGDKVWAKVRDKVGDKVEATLPNFIYPNIDGNFSVNYFAFYDFMQEVIGVEIYNLVGLYNIYKDTTKLSLIYPFEDWCVVCQKPTIINLKNNELHKDGGMALEYSDGFGLWCLNGTSVSQEIAETPAEKLPATLVLSEKNAEVRREIVRKIGIERVCKDLNSKIIDTGIDHKGNLCELLVLDIGDGRQRPFIKLVNPSIGCYHIEGVHPDCDTIEKAFNFRNGTIEKPILLT